MITAVEAKGASTRHRLLPLMEPVFSYSRQAPKSKFLSFVGGEAGDAVD
jgi:hypothetical protein